jgi:hypothetical protein
VDILGEAAVSESEAEEYAARYLRLIEALAKAIPDPNVSIKISALYSQIHPAAPERAVEQLKNRLRPLLRRAQELGVFINFDMESYALKALTIDLFKSLVEEPEFRSFGRLGVVIQAYLRDSERDLDDFIRWAAANLGLRENRCAAKKLAGAGVREQSGNRRKLRARNEEAARKRIGGVRGVWHAQRSQHCPRDGLRGATRRGVEPV